MCPIPKSVGTVAQSLDNPGILYYISNITQKEKLTMQKRSYTKAGFISLLTPVVYILAFLIFSFLATISEIPLERGGIYILFTLLSILLMFGFPVILIGCSIISMLMQIKALHNNESKPKNIGMLFVSVLYIAVSFVYTYDLYIRIMSV